MTDQLASMTVQAALASIAARTPAPGGGAAVALAAGTAAALGEMVAAYAAQRRGNASRREAIERAAGALRDARQVLLACADKDARAYQALSETMARRTRGGAGASDVGVAAQEAARVPMQIIEQCEVVIGALEALAPVAGMLVSDLVASAALSAAAARGATGHVLANTPLMDEAGLDGEGLAVRAAALAQAIDDRSAALIEAAQ